MRSEIRNKKSETQIPQLKTKSIPLNTIKKTMKYIKNASMENRETNRES